MSKIWLPIVEPTTGREQILYIPGASHMDRSQLEEILHWQKERTLAQLKAKGPIAPRVHSRKEVGQALKEFRGYLHRRQQSTHNRINF